jgi:hypothetical protein
MIAAFLVGHAVALYGSCEECQTCVKHCGRKCMDNAFGLEPKHEETREQWHHSVLALEDCCQADSQETRDEHVRHCVYNFAKLSTTCKQRVPLHVKVRTFGRCLASCGERYTETPANLELECCYETASKACGELFSMGQLQPEWELDDKRSELHNECFHYAMLHAQCPGVGELFAYNLANRTVEVRVNTADLEFQRQLPCAENATTKSAGCWQQHGHSERQWRLAAAADRDSLEVGRFYALLVYWLREYNEALGGEDMYPYKAGSRYLRAFMQQWSQWDILNDKRFRAELKRPSIAFPAVDDAQSREANAETGAAKDTQQNPLICANVTDPSVCSWRATFLELTRAHKVATTTDATPMVIMQALRLSLGDEAFAARTSPLVIDLLGYVPWRDRHHSHAYVLPWEVVAEDTRAVLGSRMGDTLKRLLPRVEHVLIRGYGPECPRVPRTSLRDDGWLDLELFPGFYAPTHPPPDLTLIEQGGLHDGTWISGEKYCGDPLGTAMTPADLRRGLKTVLTGKAMDHVLVLPCMWRQSIEALRDDGRLVFVTDYHEHEHRGTLNNLASLNVKVMHAFQSGFGDISPLSPEHRPRFDLLGSDPLLGGGGGVFRAQRRYRILMLNYTRVIAVSRNSYVVAFQGVALEGVNRDVMTAADKRRVQFDGFQDAAAKGVNPDGLTEADQRRLQYEACIGGWPRSDCNDIVQGNWKHQMRRLQFPRKRKDGGRVQVSRMARDGIKQIMREMKVYCDGQEFKVPLCGPRSMSSDDNVYDVPISQLPIPSGTSGQLVRGNGHDEL